MPEDAENNNAVEHSTPAPKPAVSGRRTSPWVLFQDRLSTGVITFGGLAVLAAMVGICLFLIQTAAPLIGTGRVTGEQEAAAQTGETLSSAGYAAFAAWPQHVVLGTGDGRVSAISLATGERVVPGVPLLNTEATAWGRDIAGNLVVAGGADGSLAFGSIRETWRPVTEAALAGQEPPAASQSVSTGDGSAVTRLDHGELQSWTAEIEDRFVVEDSGGGAAIEAVSIAKDGSRRTWLGVVRTDGTTEAIRVQRARSLIGASGGADVTRYELESWPDVGGQAPKWLFMATQGAAAVGVWADGRLALWARPSSRTATQWPLVETTPTVTGGPFPVAATMTLGQRTLLLGGENQAGEGGLWTVGIEENADGMHLVQKGWLKLGDSPVTALTPSDRDRTVAIGFEDGSGALVNMTSRKRVARTDAPPNTLADSSAATLAIVSGSLEQFLIAGGTSATVYEVEPGHPEASLHSLFNKVHYEGYEGPVYVYQSTGGGGAEPKFSLVPLVFGTLKGTAVAMLIAAPLAVLAALYTSEFLHPSVRRVVKPTIELMAMLPSVVLGFIAAALIAPLFAEHLTAVLLSLTVIPSVVVVFSGLWGLIPEPLSRRVGTLPRVGIAIAVLILAGLLAIGIAGPIESALFQVGDQPGELRGWLDSSGDDRGMNWPGLLLILAPLGVLGVLALDARFLGDWWRDQAGTGTGSGPWPFVRAVVGVAIGVVLSVLVAALLGLVGVDARSLVLGPFSQLNTLIVGVAMGFAVIPIIYTISEDAMQSVPGTLRSASLAAGATPWQTAVRVVLPVAGPGVFSACMVGLGRAVGETMIVLMATGNTPEMTGNIFSGFLALSANIATELPETPRGGTHYRVLFLCGLMLFAMTLVVNTVAELIRQHFRKKSAGL